MKHVTPSVSETAFNCPHLDCGVLTQQFWHDVYAHRSSRGKPDVVDGEKIETSFEHIEDSDIRKKEEAGFKKLALGHPFLEGNPTRAHFSVRNMWVARCLNCGGVSLWIYDKLIYPNTGTAPAPNVDMPPDILADYCEASSILDLSPRGSAALIRLCIQKLCIVLGEPGKDIYTDIGTLVGKGLNERIQKAFDIVRVLGNESVHPGQIDMTDDRATAESLFALLNLIVDKTISERNHIDEMYAKLPQSRLDAIKKRDAKKKNT